MDIGSGGGLPALPLGLVLRNCESLLIERTQKKASFLGSALKALKISGAVIPEDFSEAERNDRLAETSFGLATMRWVKLDSRILELFARFLAPKGKFVYYSVIASELFIDSAVWEMASQKYLLVGDEQEFRTVTVFDRM